MNNRMRTLKSGRRVLRLPQVAYQRGRNIRWHRGRTAEQHTDAVTTLGQFPNQVSAYVACRPGQRDQHRFYSFRYGPRLQKPRALQQDRSLRARIMRSLIFFSVTRCCYTATLLNTRRTKLECERCSADASRKFVRRDVYVSPTARLF